MKLTCLGVHGPFPPANGATSGYLVDCGDTLIQMDLGSGTLAALTARTAPEGLTAILLTHWHYDHCCDMLPLIYRLEAMAAQGQAPLDVYAPVDEKSPVRRAVQACGAIRLHDVAPGDCLTLGQVTVKVYRARHPVPAVMLRLTGEGRILCYTGDTNETAGLDEFARDADVLLADGLFPEAVWTEAKPHLSAQRAARLAADAGAKRLIITHLNPTIDPEGLLREARAIRKDAVLAERGATYAV